MLFRIIFATILALIGWTAVAVIGTAEGWWRTPLAPHGNATAFRNAVIGEISSRHMGNAAFVMIENGRPSPGYFTSVGKDVSGDSRFQVASLSKWITAWGVMTLVEDGKLDLDAPVSRYLTRWTLPRGAFSNDGVTVRRLLSHTAGLTDGLGYAGFKPGQAVQSLEASLTRTADASPGADGRVRVGLQPGSEFKYSGGGYTLLQLLVEDASGQSFNDYMSAHVFEKLGMTRSTFVLPEGDDGDVAEFYDTRGSLAPHYRFSALAAASLYTTTNDLARFLQAQCRGLQGEPPGRGILKPGTLLEMRRPHASKLGVDIWGLGTILFAPNNHGGYVVGHDGNNEPAINTAARVDPDTCDGIIILETGNKLLATTLAGEWVFWHTGRIDFLTFTMEAGALLRLVAVGWIVILAGALIAGLGWRRAHR